MQIRELKILCVLKTLENARDKSWFYQKLLKLSNTLNISNFMNFDWVCWEGKMFLLFRFRVQRTRRQFLWWANLMPIDSWKENMKSGREDFMKNEYFIDFSHYFRSWRRSMWHCHADVQLELLWTALKRKWHSRRRWISSFLTFNVFVSA